MSDMQWALVVIGVVVVFGVYLHARRQAAKQAVWDNKRKREGAEEDQLDFFADDGGFDEYGVGRARKSGGRAAPQVDAPVAEESGESEAPTADPKLFVIAVHTKDLQYMPAEDLHETLQSCGLEFGQHDIYHRFSPQGDIIFSIASVVKPGFLRPDEMDQLMTPGVSLFLQLPGAQAGPQAFEDMLTTASTLAERFNGSLLGSNRQPLEAQDIEDMREQAAAL